MLKLSLIWTLCLFLSPLLLLQGWWVRARVPRLPPASGPTTGLAAEPGSQDQHFSLLGLGDSVIAGVGVSETSEAVTSQLAQALQVRWQRSIAWQAFGVNGERLRELLPRLSQYSAFAPDLVVVSIGVNDASGLTSLTRWQWEVTRLISELKQQHNVPVVFIGLPPLGQFRRLPQPLRFALGVRAKMLDLTLQRAAELLPGVYWFETGASFQSDGLAADGYHPGPEACVVLGQQLASQLHQPLAT